MVVVYTYTCPAHLFSAPPPVPPPLTEKASRACTHIHYKGQGGERAVVHRKGKPGMYMYILPI